MPDVRFRLDEEFQDLKHRRDELRLHLGLGKREVEDMWDELDARWGELEDKMLFLRLRSTQTVDQLRSSIRNVLDNARDGFEETTDDLRAAAGQLLVEIRKDFERIKDVL